MKISDKTLAVAAHALSLAVTRAQKKLEGVTLPALVSQWEDELQTCTAALAEVQKEIGCRHEAEMAAITDDLLALDGLS